MTTEQTDGSGGADALNANVEKIESLSKRLVAAMAQRRNIDPSLQGPGQDLMMKTASAYAAEMMANPSKILEHQIAFWGKTLKHYVDTQQVLTSGQLAVPEDPTPDDKRFRNALWKSHPYFNFIKQQYMMSSQAISDAVSGLEHLEPKDKKRLEYFSQQIVDMMSPTNFLATNPDALEKAVETEGQSLVDGLENLVRDLEDNSGDLVVTLADKNAFTVGENLATTPGSVVYRGRLFELIQYTPTTEKVHKTPLLIFPPWINKFYVLDLKEKNSLIKWIVDQGYTLFVVSWVNPDRSFADVGMDDYVREGYLEAIAQVKKICDVPKVNAVGYCIGGTTLSLTAAYLNKIGDKSLNAVTLFTTLTDFSDQGEMTVFLQDDFVDGIEEEAQRNGMLDSFFMSRTFSYLRSNDLIYSPAIRSYMLGEAPPAFDLLYWNGDSTNLPAKMAIEYLRGLCQGNTFAEGGFTILGEKLLLKDVNVPICAIACETDHIAAWPSSLDGVRAMGGRSKTFILSQSGHIAGIVNPPGRKKYGHYTNDDLSLSAPDWQSTAEFHEGSWWPRWGDWLKKRSGAQIAARIPGESTHPVLAAAPGTYVVAEVKD